MGLTAVGPKTPCQKWLLGLFPQQCSSSKIPKSCFWALGSWKKESRTEITLAWRSAVYRVEWICILSHLTLMHQHMAKNAAEQFNPHRSNKLETHLLWQTLSNMCTQADNYSTAFGEQNARAGPITALDRRYYTPRTFLLCQSPKTCLFFLTQSTWSVCIQL